MKFKEPIALSKIASIIEAEIIGNGDLEVTGLNEIHKVTPGDLTFVDHPKYYSKSLNSAADIILINKREPCPEGKALLLSDDPFRDYNKLVLYFSGFKPSYQSISDSAQIGLNTIIQPGCFVGNHVKIGRNCIIHSNVSIYDYSEIGDNVIIHSNTVIGADAFYYKRRPDGYEKLQSCGRVIIEDDVEIGASCTIDKGVSGDTIIGRGTKFDNQVHIGHGTVIGKNCLFAAQVGIGGKAIIEDNVILWGQVGVSKDLTIGAGAVVLAQSGVAKSIEGGKTYFGSPVQEAGEKKKELVYLKRLPEMWKKLTGF